MYIYHNTVTKNQKRTVSETFSGDIKMFLDVLQHTIDLERLNKRSCGSVSIEVNSLQDCHDYSISGETEEERKRYVTNETKQDVTFQYGGYSLVIHFDARGDYLYWNLIGTELKKQSHSLQKNKKEEALPKIVETLLTLEKIFDAHYELLMNDVGLVHRMY